MEEEYKPYQSETLVGEQPKYWLLHGPTKQYVENYIYHTPKVGIVASYTPNEHDVHDHFGIFRGVDMVESFAQASVVSLATYLECKKQGVTPEELGNLFIPIFISIGQVMFHSYLEKGETFINIGHIKFYKFRQMVCDGRIYKVPKGLDLEAYFAGFTDERLLAYDISKEFKLVAEVFDITGRAISTKVIENFTGEIYDRKRANP